MSRKNSNFKKFSRIQFPQLVTANKTNTDFF